MSNTAWVALTPSADKVPKIVDKVCRLASFQRLVITPGWQLNKKRRSRTNYQGTRAAVIQEFGISITAVGGDQYLVRTENVETGVPHAEERVIWPVHEWLSQTKVLTHDPLLGLLQGQKNRATPDRSKARQSLRPDEVPFENATLVQLGKTLHDELFKGQLRDSWVTAQGVARNRQDLLRLRLGIKDSRIQQLPWEALAGPRPLATGTDVIFSRYILNRPHAHAVGHVRQGEAAQVLRILMVIAAPNDQERLELKREAHHLQSELHPENIAPDDTVVDVQLTILEQPGRAELTQELERGNYQALHYAGHSNLGNAGGDLYLVSRQTGLTERLSGEDLAGLLVNNGIKLAVFNSCRGAYSAASDQGWQERNLAQALVNRGMPAVIAMTERIPDHVAISFTQLLYRNLKKGQSIDLSLNRTRQGLISAYGSHQFYWALPTLYMHPSFDGYLVKTLSALEHGAVENANVLDSANDPFGDMFAEPGLAEIDLPLRLEAGSGASVGPRKRGAQMSSGIDKGAVLSAIRSTLDDQEPVDDRNLVKNNDVAAASSVIEDVSLPNSVDIDGELSVPNNIETPAGFYGEPAVSPTVPTIDSASDGASAPAAAKASVAHKKLRNNQSQEKAQHPQSADLETKSDADSGADSGADSELVGERLTRSHTLHTKLLTGQTLAFAALLALLTVTAVGWLRKGPPEIGPGSQNRTSELSTGELSLPAAIEVALNQDDLDSASASATALIEQGEFEAVLAALQTADRQQMEDVVVAFLRGRAQWGLVKQGDVDYAPADAMLSWTTALESESDWLEIMMALGFAQYASGQEQLALETWEKVVAQAARNPGATGAYFSEQPYGDYALNAQAGVAMAALSLSKIEADPAERNRLIEQASEAYQQVMREEPAAFSSNALGGNWLWLGSAIAEWDKTKEELSQTVTLE